MTIARQGGSVPAMDPNETFQMMLDAIARGDRNEAGELANVLAEWMQRGGFAPALSLTDRFNQPQPIDRELIVALVNKFRMPEHQSVRASGPSPLDD
ncbi:hypothetical protein [Rhodopirellula europaea]|nr:hypothetical protein [Rhodopirellula europaea]